MSSSSEEGDGVIGLRLYVGNIPYQATRQQLIDVFSRVGEVTNVRVMTDPETGRPRGYGFVMFRNPDHCRSAIRNLNNYELREFADGRSLRVDYPEGDKAVLKARESGLQVPISGAAGSGQGAGGDSIIGAAAEAAAAVPTAEVVSQLLKTFSRAELIDILAEMKRFAENNPIAARQLLFESPQLAHALLQIQLLFGLVSQPDLQQIQQRASQQVQQHPPQPPPYSHPPPPGPPHPHAAGVPPPHQPAQPLIENALGIKLTQDQLRRLPLEQQKVLEMVFQLTPQQVRTLPPELQKQLYDLKMQLERQL